MRVHAIDVSGSMTDPPRGGSKNYTERAVQYVEQQNSKDFAICFSNVLGRVALAPKVRDVYFEGGGTIVDDVAKWMEGRFLRETDELIIYTDMMDPFILQNHYLMNLPFKLRFMIPKEFESTLTDRVKEHFEIGFYD